MKHKKTVEEIKAEDAVLTAANDLIKSEDFNGALTHLNSSKYKHKVNEKANLEKAVKFILRSLLIRFMI